MDSFNRRRFLAGSAATVAGPALRAMAAPAELDAVVVGAGAAGIAAARRLAAAGRRFALVEATDRVGGRCITDTAIFDVPFDRGAHWIHTPDLNPLAKLAPQTGLDIYPAPRGQRVRIGRRNAREGEMEDFLADLVRANRMIADAARGKTDVPCDQALPKDLGVWRPCIDFVLGPFGCGKDLDQVSAIDFSKSAERDVDAFCRQGYGALLAKLAAGLPLQLSTPVTRIDWSGRRIEVRTSKGELDARSVIVTASTGVLAANKIKFDPELPRRQLDAITKLSLGSYDHVAIQFSGNPLGLDKDDLVFEQASDPKTAALLANVSGTTLCLVEVGGSFGASLSDAGPAAMVDFAVGWLAGLYGSEIKQAVRRSHATQWNKEPWALGAFSAAVPGGQFARRTLMDSMRDRVWFAGEAAHETLWGTVAGAWESGERAAEAVLKKLGR